MNKKIYGIITNFSYALVSNLTTLLISIIVILFVPKLIGVEDFGYWQLYLFYSSYAGFLLLGWNDGIYLRYGGKFYDDLNRRLFFSQFYMVVFLQMFFVICLFVYSFYINDEQTSIIIKMVGISLFITNITGILLFTLQATNNIKEYANITIAGRLLYFIILIILILVGIRDYKLLIVTDLIGKAGSLLYAVYYCKDIVFYKIYKFYFSFKEAFENIRVGIKLMFANIASMLIIGSVRFGIERSWDVATFGKVSLTLNIANLMMVFINAIGLIMFPILRRTDEIKLPNIYKIMREYLIVILLGVLIIYYPLKEVLLIWLPQYTDGLKYMAVLLPMFIYEGKMALLINTYLKTLRKEKLLLIINLISLVLSLIITFITTVILNNLDLAVFSVIILIAFRCILAEILLTKMLKISVYEDIILELMMTLTFIISGWFISSWEGILLYAIAYICYLLIKRKNLIRTYHSLKLLFKSKEEITQ